MEAEKIKTAEEIEIANWMKKQGYDRRAAKNVAPIIVRYLEQHQSAQPPVSVMPSEEKLKEIIAHCWSIGRTGTDDSLKEAVDTILPRFLSLSKEAPKERMPNVGKTIKKRHIGHDKIIKIIRNNSGYEYVTGQGMFANDVRIHKVAKEVVDLFKQRK